MTSTIDATPGEKEGVAKFKLEFLPAPPQPQASIAELNAWRQILFRLGLTGRDPTRYQGLAYGNLSRRAGTGSYIVSGTQTGAKPCLSPDDYCLVVDFDLENNRIRAEGPVEPSSEALTHGAIYAGNPQAECVIHIHSPEIWRNTRQLGITFTAPSIAYGTQAMGRAVQEASGDASAGVIAMGGHEDGVIAYAPSVEQAAVELLRCLAKALELEQQSDDSIQQKGSHKL